MRRIIPYESAEQMALFQWIAMQRQIAPYVLSIPNEGMRTPKMGQRLKRMGLMAGASDILVAYPTKLYHGLFLELKRQTGSIIKPEQLMFQENMRKVGYAAVICKGWLEAKAVIQDYLAGEMVSVIVDIP